MAKNGPGGSRVGALVALAGILRHDEPRPDDELVPRDRAIGRRLAHLRDRPGRQLLTYAQQAAADTPHEPTADPPSPGEALRDAADAGRAVDRGCAAAFAVAAAAGAIVGGATAGVVFRYDGTHPVNIVYALAVFVGLQLALLTLFIAATAIGRRWAAVPGLRDLGETAEALRAAAVRKALAHRLAQRHRDTLHTLFGEASAHQRIFGRVQKWAAALWLQGFAVGFNAAAIAVFAALVVFTDIAFGWSTTLRVEPETFHTLTVWIAGPWSYLIGEPTLELVEATRYYRLAPQRAAEQSVALDPDQLGGWWPFVLGCLLVYGLLPRLITLGVAWLRLRTATDTAATRLPGAGRLLERLNRPVVETHGEGVEPDDDHRAPPPDAPAAAPAPDTQGPWAVVNWSDALPGPVAPDPFARWLGRSGVTVAAQHQAGGSRGVEHDDAVLSELRRTPPGAVAVAVRAWEPPVGELLDFLGALRQAVGPSTPIVVLAAGDTHAPPAETDIRQWRRKAGQLGDPWLRVVGVPGQEGAAP